MKYVKPKPALEVAKVVRRDPRFDSLCGEFIEKKFHRHYEFVNEMKEDEIKKLNEELKEETDPKKIKKIKYVIQRLKNQLVAEKKRKIAEDKSQKEKQEVIDALKQGRKPFFQKKSDKKKEELKKKFDTLKKEGRLDQYMAKKRKHNTQKDRKYIPETS
nr:EOG090X0E8U [Macrothrix elegans]